MLKLISKSTKSSASCSRYVDHVLTPSPATETISSPYVVMEATWHAAVPELEAGHMLYKIVTPYNPKSWQLALQQANLMHLFLNLVHDLTHSTPIGNLPPFMHTFIPNKLSQLILTQYMNSFLAEEFASSDMDGLFSVDSAHHIFREHFHMAPLSFFEKPG